MLLTISRACAIFLLAVMFVTTGCSSVPNPAGGTKVHTVTVGSTIEPVQLYAGQGHEIQWVNKRPEPIAVMFRASDKSRITCHKGFTTITPSVMSAVIPPEGSASLCFSEQGKYNYDIRFDENIAAAALDEGATVWVVARGERNPKPGEEYQNIVP